MNTAAMTQEILDHPSWNQAKLAKHLGVSQGTISRWKNGTDPEGPSRDALRELHAEVVGTPQRADLELDEQRAQAITRIGNLDPDQVPLVLDFLGVLEKSKKS